MNLDKLTIEIRPRRTWEAADLGILMARRWWLQLASTWVMLSFPLFVLLAFLPLKWLWLQPLLLWWLKPLFERPLLFILSRTVFDEYPSTRQALRAFPSLALTQVFSSLLWRRLSLTRSLDLPVLQLEGLAGAERSKRLAVLHREGISPASALTIYGIHIESFLAMGIAGIVFFLIPPSIDVHWQNIYVELQSRWLNLAINFLAYLGAAVVAPFYVASGFSLYLNRRIKLEAWDVEIAFKRIVNKRVANGFGAPSAEQEVPASSTKKTPRNPINVPMSLLFATLLSTSYLPRVEAQTQVSEATEVLPLLQDKNFEKIDSAQSAFDTIAEIKKLDVFNQRQVLNYPKFPWADLIGEEDDANDFDLSGLDWLRDAAVFIASVAEFVLWGSVIFLILVVAYRYRQWLLRYTGWGGNVRKPTRPSVMFGMEITQESMPENVADTALAYWRAGKKRQALALLYLACLYQMIERGVDFGDGDTEGVCLTKAKMHTATLNATNPGSLAYFEALTGVWQRFAYGHLEPEDAGVVTLCERWSVVWQATESSSRAQ